MKYVATGLLALAYLFAVLDGVMADKGLYLEDAGRTGLKRYTQDHPYIVIGAGFGIAGTIVGLA